MLPSPLQLDRLFFEEVSVVANPDHERREGTSLQGTNKIECSRNEKTGQWMFRIRIELGKQEGAPVPAYEIKFTGVIVGRRIGERPADVSEEAERRWLGSSLCSILYSAGRQVVLSATATSRYGPFILPAVHFPAADMDLLMRTEGSVDAPGSVGRQKKKATKRKR